MLKQIELPDGSRRLFGRKRPIATAPRLKLKNYLLKTMPAPPARYGYMGAAKPQIHQIYLNNALGDCVEAAIGHAIGVFGAQNGAKWFFSDEQITAMYSAMGGYIPGDPATDQGTDIGTALSVWQKPGVSGPGGTHIIQGSVSVDVSNPEEYRTAIWLFENLILGLELPDAWVNPFPSENGFVWDVAGAPDPSNGHCFTADTKVSLLDGRELSFAELTSGAAGGSFWVYSCDAAGNVVPGLAHSPRKTIENAPLVSVTLDSGDVIRCTPNHQFLMRDGIYRAASELQFGDSLMPLYRRENRYGYEEFLNPRTEGWWKTYQVAAFGTSGNGHGLVAHHRDFNKRNNSPDNLQPMTKIAHRQLHEETARILNSYARSEKGRAKSSELMKALWANPEWRAKMDASIKERTAAGGRALALAGGGLRGMDKDRLRSMCREIGIKAIPRITSKENHEKSQETRRKRIKDDPEFLEKLRRTAAQARQACALKRAAGEVINHKVTNVEPSGRDDVYDFTVDQHHNFALTSGVFVHNCILATNYDQANVYIATWGMNGVMTDVALQEYCSPQNGGELYAVLSKDVINRAQQRAPNGFAFSQLLADLNSLA